MKICSGCKQKLPLENFGKRKNSKDGLMYECKSCINSAAKEKRKCPKVRAKEAANRKAYREANPDHQKAYQKANPDKHIANSAKHRARRRNQTPELTNHEKAHIDHIYFMAQEARAVTGEMYHVDHIKPLSKGGLHHPSNLQVMYGLDNLKKGAKYDGFI